MISFNHINVNLFYDNLVDLYGRFRFEPQCIWNVDETGLTTVQNPGKIVPQKGVKQVTSAERGKLATLCCAVNALGHAIPQCSYSRECGIMNILLMVVHQDA